MFPNDSRSVNAKNFIGGASVGSMGRVVAFLLLTILAIQFQDSHGYAETNYPDNEFNQKPCAQKSYTVRFEGPICVPEGKDGFTPDSNTNCVEKLKNECPEFNQATCMWYEFKVNNCSLSFPTCRLRYYAKGSHAKFHKFTWMEIYYVNQFGTADSDRSMFTILELHRFIKDNSSFPYPQKDFPAEEGGVPDPNGVAGLKWAPYQNSSNLTFPGERLCKGGQDDGRFCVDKVAPLFSRLYEEGALGGPGFKGATTISRCGPYLVDGPGGIKSPAVCRVGMVRAAPKPYNKFEQQVVEGQAYFDGAKKQLVVRFAVLGGNVDYPDYRKGH
ncbi:hypothetical protein M8J75_004091 [Diaphorina citri]|nr:hypothetical protein M8J75_004091 [Diaphorina citri]